MGAPGRGHARTPASVVPGQAVRQLLGRTGHASPAGIAATTALALGELETIVACSPRQDPGTLDATMELNLDTHEVQRRPWPPHPDCGCRTLSTTEPGTGL